MSYFLDLKGTQVERIGMSNRDYGQSLIAILNLTTKKFERKLLSSTSQGVDYYAIQGGSKLRDHYTFLRNCPPTPPLSQHFGLSGK